MAHNIDRMMYTGAKPWHGLGTKLEHAATAAEAIAAANLGWNVVKEPVYLKSGATVPDAFATVRQDNNNVLGVVGKVYQPLQNKEAFSFFDAVVGSKEAIYHTAGSLGLGEKIWILAKLPGQIRVIGDDITDKFLLLMNSHDGTGAVQIMFTPIRVVCQNTLNIALGKNQRKQSIRHTASIGIRVNDVQSGLGIVNEKFRIFEEAAQALTRVQVNSKSWQGYLKNLGIIPTTEQENNLGIGRMYTRAQNIINEVSELFEYGKGQQLPGVKGTAWAAFNAISEYVDYTRSTKGSADDSRAKSLLFGSGSSLKQKAWDLAVSLV